MFVARPVLEVRPVGAGPASADRVTLEVVALLLVDIRQVHVLPVRGVLLGAELVQVEVPEPFLVPEVALVVRGAGGPAAVGQLDLVELPAGLGRGRPLLQAVLVLLLTPLGGVALDVSVGDRVGGDVGHV